MNDLLEISCQAVGKQSLFISHEEGEITYHPLNLTWQAKQFIENIPVDNFTLTEDAKRNLQPILWHSACTEFDARFLYQNIQQGHLQENKYLSTYFNKWRFDEENHADGFMALYGRLFKEDFCEIKQEIGAREIDFSPVRRFFTNPLRLLILLVYDELITTHVYHDSISLYQKIGGNALAYFGRKLKFDEAQHFFSFFKFAKKYAKRSGESVENILSEIIDIDFSMNQYHGTFVLDHACPEFPMSRQAIEKLCQQVIIDKVYC